MFFESVIVNLEYGKYGFVFGLGMVVISVVIMLLDKGDYLVFNFDVYGGIYCVLIKVFICFGIDVDFVDIIKIENIE